MIGILAPRYWLLILLVLLSTLEVRRASAQSNGDSFELPPLDAFNAIVERPLFSRDRRPVATAAEPSAQGGQTDEIAVDGQLLLAGTATDQGDRAVAILRDVAQGTQYRVRVGDQVAGWTVEAIRPREIVLATANQQVTVTLDEPALPEPAAER